MYNNNNIIHKIHHLKNNNFKISNIYIFYYLRRLHEEASLLREDIKRRLASLKT